MSLQQSRQKFTPQLPHLLQNITQVIFTSEQLPSSPVQSLFPHLSKNLLLHGKTGTRKESSALRIGVLFSGGPASGGHNVISGLFDALKQLDHHSELFGFLDGPEGVIRGKYRELTQETITPYRNQGGFDLIGSGRTKIETEEQLSDALGTVTRLKLDGLVIIGGDDSNTNAAVLSEFFLQKGSSVKVIGVPKTIDGDLKNSYVTTSFGFDTACKTYAEIIGNIARDAISSKKYYHFIKLMGRSASHIALECALKTQPNFTLIGEEVAAKKKTLSQITAEIADLISMRAEQGKNYGVILIPEGLIEFIPEIHTLIQEVNRLLAGDPSLTPSQIVSKLSAASQQCFHSLPEKIGQQLLAQRDPHGNVHVSLIETERLLMEMVTKELKEREKKGSYKGKFAGVAHFLGYEGRAGFPSNFDCNYCYALGYTAALLLSNGSTGYMAFVSNLTKPPEQWGIGGVPLPSLMRLEMRKGKEKPVIEKALVTLSGKPFVHFEKHRQSWMNEDRYLYPGPIQFFGEAALTEQVPMTLLLENN